MPRSSRLKKTRLALCLSALLCTAAAQASQSYQVSAYGKPLLELNFYAPGEDPYVGNLFELPGDIDFGNIESELPFRGSDIAGALQAAQLWADLIGRNAQNSTPVEFTIVKYSAENAEAMAVPNLDADGVFREYLTTQDLLLNDIPMQSPGVIFIGEADFELAPHLSTLPQKTGMDINATIFHELGHALGIAENSGLFGVSSPFTEHLYDRFGTRLTPDLEVVHVSPYDDITEPEDGMFYAGEYSLSGVYFIGENVSEVLQGSALPGILINGCEYYGTDEDGDDLYSADLSHLELERSMMSHQSYRNYTFFMEAELALLQDLGYSIDRKAYYGRSIYGSNQTIVNNDPFYARSADGTAYLEGAPNFTALGTGLHIYGSDNTVIQNADLLACGTAGVGVRVDGSRTSLYIPEETSIRADGAYGTGILFAYGVGQSLTVDGLVTALGLDGVGLRFDFGHNLLSDDPEKYAGEYRGSYIWQNPYYDLYREDIDGTITSVWIDPSTGYELNLDGAMMDDVTIAGTVAGQGAAIFISDNALVSGLNFKAGARIYGDIISKWDPHNPLIDPVVLAHPETFDLYTDLTFEDAAQADAEDSVLIAGNISGKESFRLAVDAAKLITAGSIEAFSLKNDGELTVLGENADGRAIELADSLELSENSVLALPLTAAGLNTTLAASDGVLDGRLNLIAQPGFYRNNAPLPIELKLDGTFSGSFAAVESLAADSPTLSFGVSSLEQRPDGLNAEAQASRAPDAYAQYALSAADASLGEALYGISQTADGWAADLIGALDFSSQDGSDISRALPQLGAAAFDEAAASSLKMQQSFDRAQLGALLSEPDFSAQGTRVYADFSAAYYDADGSGSEFASDGYGLILGFDHKLSPAWTFGLNLQFADLSTDIDKPGSASYDAQSAQVGARLFYRPALEGFYGLSSLRLGAEQGDLTRSVHSGTFSSRPSSDFTSLIGGAQLAGGYNFGFAHAESSLSFGPFALLQYAFLSRPDVTEDGAAGLSTEGEYYASLPLSAGLNLDYESMLAGGGKVKLGLHGAFFHELLDTDDSTGASFKDYAVYKFFSDTERTGDYGMRLEGRASLELAGGLRFKLTLGGEFAGDDARECSAQGEISYRF